MDAFWSGLFYFWMYAAAFEGVLLRVYSHLMSYGILVR